jgi:hypothetical protein
MDEPELSKNEDFRGRESEHDLEIWRHRAGVGGEDKNRMVVIASWLLGLSAVILGSIASQVTEDGGWTLEEPRRAFMVAMLGIFVSAVAGYVALLYGGYSNRNWAKADEIARRQGWRNLVPPDDSTPHKSTDREAKGPLNSIAWRFARPCRPKEELAPVFKVFLGLSAGSLLLHLAVLVWSL